MYLVQLLLPLFDNEGEALPAEHCRAVMAELTERFGGLTAFTRAPAEGAWREADQPTRHDDIIVIEVMVDALDRPWWTHYRQKLERLLRQRMIVIRVQPMELL